MSGLSRIRNFTQSKAKKIIHFQFILILNGWPNGYSSSSISNTLYVLLYLYTYPYVIATKRKREILDVIKSYYCQLGKTETLHKPRVQTNYTLITKQRPTVTWKGWSCTQWIKSKKIIGSFWIGSYDTTYSQETHMVYVLECWEMINSKKCGDNLMQKSATAPSFTALPTGDGKWYATREYHALNCLVKEITLKNIQRNTLLKALLDYLTQLKRMAKLYTTITQ